MSALAHAVPIVKRWEGCRLEAYLCPAGIWTIGWGATGPGIVKGLRWTQAQADDRLALDLDRFLKGVRSVLMKPATDAQLGAMTSLAYNIGVGAFKDSTLLRKFNAGDIAGAAAEFPKWVRSKGVALKGLVDRRADERRVFLGEAG